MGSCMTSPPSPPARPISEVFGVPTATQPVTDKCHSIQPTVSRWQEPRLHRARFQSCQYNHPRRPAGQSQPTPVSPASLRDHPAALAGPTRRHRCASIIPRARARHTGAAPSQDAPPPSQEAARPRPEWVWCRAWRARRTPDAGPRRAESGPPIVV